MIGFIVGVFVGAMAGVVLIGLVSLNRFEEQEQEKRELDITPQLVQTSWAVVRDYLKQRENCDGCPLKKECDRSKSLLCEFL